MVRHRATHWWVRGEDLEWPGMEMAAGLQALWWPGTVLKQPAPAAHASSRFIGLSQPAKDEEVVAAERAPKRNENEVESCFQSVPASHRSEIDRSAMGTPSKKHIVTTQRLLPAMVRAPPPLFPGRD